MTAHICHEGYDADCADCVSHDETCGLRCHVCNDRMCAWFGPEPQPGCRTVCADCPPCDCTACGDARDDRAMEAAVVAERDARLGVAS